MLVTKTNLRNFDWYEEEERKKTGWLKTVRVNGKILYDRILNGWSEQFIFFILFVLVRWFIYLRRTVRVHPTLKQEWHPFQLNPQIKQFIWQMEWNWRIWFMILLCPNSKRASNFTKYTSSVMCPPGSFLHHHPLFWMANISIVIYIPAHPQSRNVRNAETTPFGLSDIETQS